MVYDGSDMEPSTRLFVLVIYPLFHHLQQIYKSASIELVISFSPGLMITKIFAY
jgi:hypothetical protein